MCWGHSFPPNSVFFPRRLPAHYSTRLPFERRPNYLLMVRVFAEWQGRWWRWVGGLWVESESDVVSRQNEQREQKTSVIVSFFFLCVCPQQLLSETTCDWDSAQLLIKIPRRTRRAISLLQLQLYLFISLMSPSPHHHPLHTDHSL